MFEESGHLCDEPDPTRDPKALPLRHVSMREMRLPMSPILSVSRWHKDVFDVRKSLMPPPHRQPVHSTVNRLAKKAHACGWKHNSGSATKNGSRAREHVLGSRHNQKSVENRWL